MQPPNRKMLSIMHHSRNLRTLFTTRAARGQARPDPLSLSPLSTTARPCAGAACEAVWLLGGASTAHAEPPARLPCLNCGTAALYSASFRCEETQTTLRGHPCCDAHGRLRDALRREAPERGRRPAIAICPTQPFPTGLQAPGARRWPRLPVPPSLAERMPSLAGTASKEAIHSESQAPDCSAQLS